MEEAYSNEKLVREIQRGADPDGRSLEQLYLQNFGLLRRIARKYSTYNDMDDLCHEGYFALLSAVAAYDHNRGLSFASYYCMWLKWRFLHYQEEQSGGKDDETVVLSLDAVMNDDGFTLADVVPDPKDQHGETLQQTFNDELSAVLWRSVDALPEEQADIIKAFYRDGKPLSEACKERGISYSVGRDLKASGMRKLRQGKTAKQLRRFLDEEVFSRGIRRTGLSVFQQTGSSATEAAALWLANE